MTELEITTVVVRIPKSPICSCKLSFISDNGKEILLQRPAVENLTFPAISQGGAKWCLDKWLPNEYSPFELDSGAYALSVDHFREKFGEDSVVAMVRAERND
jgi:hypothetical protein